MRSGAKAFRRMVAMAAVVCLSAGFSCISPHGAVSADTDPLGWTASRPATVVFDNRDTLCTCDIRIFLRHTRFVERSSLGLYIETLTPDSLRTTEYVEVPIVRSPHAGADLTESSALYRSGVRLARTGVYTFRIVPVATPQASGGQAGTPTDDVPVSSTDAIPLSSEDPAALAPDSAVRNGNDAGIAAGGVSGDATESADATAGNNRYPSTLARSGGFLFSAPWASADSGPQVRRSFPAASPPPAHTTGPQGAQDSMPVAAQEQAVPYAPCPLITGIVAVGLEFLKN